MYFTAHERNFKGVNLTIVTNIGLTFPMRLYRDTRQILIKWPHILFNTLQRETKKSVHLNKNHSQNLLISIRFGWIQSSNICEYFSNFSANNYLFNNHDTKITTSNIFHVFNSGTKTYKNGNHSTTIECSREENNYEIKMRNELLSTPKNTKIHLKTRQYLAAVAVFAELCLYVFFREVDFAWQYLKTFLLVLILFSFLSFIF